MDDPEPDLSPSEREAIDAIRRDLDREFGGPRIEAPTTALAILEPSAPPRESTGLTVALALGAGTLLAASMMVLTAYTAPSGPRGPYASTAASAEAPARPASSADAASPRPDAMAAPHVARAGRRHAAERVGSAGRVTGTERVPAAERVATAERVIPAERVRPAERAAPAERTIAAERGTAVRGPVAPRAVATARIRFTPPAERPVPIQAP